MPRIARLVVKGEKTVYHVMSRTALPGYVLEDVEKDFLLKHILRLAKVYFAEVLGFCIMGNIFTSWFEWSPGNIGGALLGIMPRRGTATVFSLRISA